MNTALCYTTFNKSIKTSVSNVTNIFNKGDRTDGNVKMELFHMRIKLG
jgi:hypothetical protein